MFRHNVLGTKTVDYVPNGHIGVILFFVISGFLITFLLMKERDNYGRISIKDFWLRRIFRIWPVYYLVLLISVFFFETIPSGTSIAYALAIMPNFSHAIGCGWGTSPQIWSVGVENQFYLLFPIIVMLVSRKRLLWFLFIIIMFFAITPHLIDYVNVRIWENAGLTKFNGMFFYESKFDCIGIGCVAGYLYAEGHKLLEILFNKCLFIICLLLCLLLWCANLEIPYFTDEFMAILFAVIILNICVNPNLSINIDNKITTFIGDVSYGIYMYHWIILIVAFKVLPINDSLQSTILLYFCVLCGTILTAWVSYISYEKYFLSIKKRYEHK